MISLIDVNHIKREVIRNIQKQNPIEAKTELKNQTLYNYTQAEIVLKDLFMISFRNGGETLPGTKYCLSNITRLISKLIGVKFGNSSGDINDSTFHPGRSKLYNIHRRGEKYKLCSLDSGFTVDHLIGELSGTDSAEVLRQDVK